MDKVEEINMIFERLEESNEEIQKNALDMLLQFVKGTHTLAASSTMNFSYLEENKSRLEKICNNLKEYNKRYLSDILSVIYVMTDDSLSLHYRMGGNIIPLETWGHQYVKKIMGCMLKFLPLRPELESMAWDCVSFLFRHNMELDAIDFLDEMKREDVIMEFVDEHNYDRINLYLSDMKRYNEKYETLLLKIHTKMCNYSAILVSLLGTNPGQIADFVSSVDDVPIKVQLSFMLARVGHVLPQRDEFVQNVVSNTSLYSISCNRHLSSFFLYLCTDLQILKPKSIPDFLRGSTSLRHEKEISIKCLAPICIANGFVHLGFGRDTIFAPRAEDPRIEIDFEVLGKAAKSEIISVFSSVGAINMYSPEKTLESLNEYMFSDNPFKKTAALLGFAISNIKVFDENHTVLALLMENLKVDCNYQRIATIFALQLIYSGTHENRLLETLKELVYYDSVEVSCFASFALGSIFMGSADLDITSLLIQNFVDKSFAYSDSLFFGLFMLGFSLLFHKNRNFESVLKTLREMKSPYYSHISVLIRCQAYFGSGDTELMNEILGEAFEEEDVALASKPGKGDAEMQTDGDESKTQEEKLESSTDAKTAQGEHSKNLLKAISLIGITLLSMGDEMFSKMALRIINSSNLLDNSYLKSTIPLCLALLNPSNPTVDIVDTLNKLCNNPEQKVVLNSIMALGMVGAGTNNTRIAESLELQYAYNTKCLKAAPAIKISQGLLHLGKGTMTLSPFVFHKSTLVSKNFVGLLAAVFLLIDPDHSPMLSKYMYLNYFFVQASSLKQVVVVDEEMKYAKTQLRIGEPVNNVGIVGRPRKIASVQTHNSPIILQENEMVELYEDERIHPLTSYIEDVVVVRTKC